MPKNEDGTASEYKNPDGSTAEIQVIYDPSTNQYIPEITAGLVPSTVSGQLVVKPNELLNLQDFLNNWNPSWAKELIYYHPERC
ncbi:MAG: hypothetical protein IPL25_19195 [Saprospiraceae bacterium]|nr:hypothetical protein [Candidatus Vicinibacter affinis]